MLLNDASSHAHASYSTMLAHPTGHEQGHPNHQPWSAETSIHKSYQEAPGASGGDTMSPSLAAAATHLTFHSLLPSVWRPSQNGPLIDDLPFDILSVILELVVSLEQEEETYFEKLHNAWVEQFTDSSLRVPPNPHLVPYRLSTVNKTWRTTILSLLSAWNRFVYHPQYSSPHETGECSYIPQAIAFSRQMPLDAAIWLPSQHDSGNANMCRSIHPKALEAIVESSGRWKSLRLFVGPFSESSLTFGPLTHISTRLLQLTSLSIASDDTNIPAAGVITLFKDAPMLRRLEICGIAARSLSLPWSQIRHLKTRWLQFRDLIDLLSRCSDIESLEWTVKDPEVWVRTAMSSCLQLHCLTSIDLHIADGAHITCVPSVLSKFSLPALQQLELAAAAPNGLFCSMKSAEALANLIIDCTALRELSLSGIYFQERDLSAILPTLTRLFVIRLVESTSRPEDHEGYLPLLHGLAHKNDTQSSRNPVFPQLRRLEYSNSGSLSQVHLDLLNSLGMVLSEQGAFEWVLP